MERFYRKLGFIVFVPIRSCPPGGVHALTVSAFCETLDAGLLRHWALVLPKEGPGRAYKLRWERMYTHLEGILVTITRALSPSTAVVPQGCCSMQALI